MSNSLPLGLMLRGLRERMPVQVRKAAAALDVDPSLLSRWESGQRVPTPAQIERLADYYGVPKRELEAKRIAQKFLSEHRDNPALADALMTIQETAPAYGVNNRRKNPK